MTEHAKGVLITTGGVLAITPDSLLIRLIDAPEMTVVFWRAAFAALVMVIGLTLVYRGRTIATVRGLGGYGFAYAALMSVATMLFVLAVQLTSVANAVFLVSTSPVFSALVSRFLLGERLSTRMLWTIVFALLGVGVIAFGTVAEGGSGLAGDLCALGTAFALAVAFTVARAARAISMVPAAALAYVITTLATLPFAAPATMQAMDFAYAALLGCIFVPLGTSLMALGPRYITSPEVSLLLLLEAILAPILVWVVIGEEPSTATLIGGAIVIAVLAITNLVALGLLRRPPATGRTR